MKSKIVIVSLLIALHSFIASGEQLIVPICIKQSKEYSLVSNFLETYVNLLKEGRTVAISDTIQRAKDNGLKYTCGNDAVMRLLTGKEEFNISLNDMIYNVEWRDKGTPIVGLSFPANIALLTFSNKIDLEKKMQNALENLPQFAAANSIPTCSVSNLTKISLSDYYISDGGYYITPRLKNQIVYCPSSSNDSVCEMLMDSTKYKVETISNIVLSGYSPADLDFRIRLDHYGYKSTEIKVPFSQLFHMLSAEGSVPYWGTNKYDGSVVEGIYVWINRYRGYAHLMNISIPISAVTSPSIAEGNMHCYIRLDNLKTLFEEYQDL